jgi:hypothetical protein
VLVSLTEDLAASLRFVSVADEVVQFLVGRCEQLQKHGSTCPRHLLRDRALMTDQHRRGLLPKLARDAEQRPVIATRASACANALHWPLLSGIEGIEIEVRISGRTPFPSVLVRPATDS